MISIEINPETTFQDIQKVFSKGFPFLRLQFFKLAAANDKSNKKKDLLENHEEKVGHFTSMAMDKVFVLHPNMLVKDFEKLFEDKLHLHVQVFYKSGNSWLETIESDSISLHKLNEMAKERSETIIEEIEPQDYHEQE